MPESKLTSSIRRYASVESDKHGTNPGQDTKLPPHALRWPVSVHPTPYEIFNMPKDSPYNKLRYYQLVMMYHPDRHHHTSHDGVPHLTKLDRYRLVVSANDLLSDPERRRQYDLCGAGWGSDVRTRLRSADRAWHQEPGNASMNATWEDWERWRQERDGVKQAPLFMSNAMFASLVVVFVLIGGWSEVTRAGRHSAGILQMKDQQHSAISQQLRERESKVVGLTKEDRVERFLRQRESWQYDRPSRRPEQEPGREDHK